MKRSEALELIKYAGYHNDIKSYIRLLVENRISKVNADIAFNNGKIQKQKGVKCHCFICNK